MHDSFDRAILAALQADATLTNAALSEKVHLSPSQCSRRKAALEATGTIRRYRAELDAKRLGLAVHALVRITFRAHSEASADDFAGFLESMPAIQEAHMISGSADYALTVRAATLDELSDLIHRQLLPHPQVEQVRSDIVLKTVKPDRGLPIAR